MKGILLDANFDVIVSNGKLRIGDTSNQDAAIVLKLSKGDLKEDLLLGPGLTQFIRGKHKGYKIDQVIRENFARAGINYEEFKDKMRVNINTTGL